MSAFTSADLERPQTNIPPSRRVRSPEELAYELDQIDNADFKLSPAGEARRKELADALAEQSAELAVDKQRILAVVATAAQIEEIANEAIAALETYVAARELLFELRRPYEVAWRAAQVAGIAVPPRNRTAAPMSLSHRLAKVSRWGWYS